MDTLNGTGASPILDAPRPLPEEQVLRHGRLPERPYGASGAQWNAKGQRVAKDTGQTNEGEGNSTVVRSYNKAQRHFVISGSLDEKSREAESEVDGPEAQELTQTEGSGLRRMAKKDPAAHRNYHKKVKDCSYVIWERASRPHGRDRERAEAGFAKPQSR